MKLSIKTRLIGGFAIVLILIIITSITAITKLHGMNKRIDNIVNVSAEKVMLAAMIKEMAISISRAEKNIILSGTQAEMNEYSLFIEKTFRDMGTKKTKLRKLADYEGRAKLDKFASVWAEYLKINKKVRNLARLNSNVKAKNLSQNQAREAFDRAVASITTIVDKNDIETDRAVDLTNLKRITEEMKLGTRIKNNLVEIQRGEKNLILAITREEMDKYSKAIEDIQKDLEKRLESLNNLSERDSREKLKEFERYYRGYKELHKKVKRYSMENGNIQAFDLSSGKGRETSDRAIEIMEEIITKNSREMEEDKKVSDKNYTAAMTLMIGLSITSLLIGLIASIINIRAILIPLSRLKDATKEIGKGNLDINIKIEQQDEIGKVIASFNRMSDDLQKITVSKNYVHNIINTMSESLLVLSPETEIKTVNKAILDMLGHKESDMVNHPVNIVLPKETLKIELDNLIKTNSTFSKETFYISKQGKTIPVIFSASLMKDNSGNIEGIVCLAMDISNRLEMESALLQSEKMASIGRLAAGVAHEINNPLTNVSLNIQELMNSSAVDRNVLQEIKAIEKNIERASTIIKELLQFSWQGETEYIPVDINNTVKSTLTLLRYVLASITVNENLTEIPEIMGDPIKLEQVLINILHNSIDAMPNGGNIDISTYCKNGLVNLIISDTGAGIMENNLSKIFDPFFTTKEISKGTGLGLSICYGIIKQHNGFIEVSSESGKGTTITIKLQGIGIHDKNTYS